MPPKTRGSKTSKENIEIKCKSKTKTTSKITKLPRKALADKTNSASDDNATCLLSKQSVKVCKIQDDLVAKKRPRRDRRVPSRYVLNNGLNKLTNGKNITGEIPESYKTSPNKSVLKVILSPLKSPNPSLDSSLTATRPKRVCRLPSKFEDHSVSPSKFIPVQPAYASTPIVLKKGDKQIEKKSSNTNVISNQARSPSKTVSAKSVRKRVVKKRANDHSKSHSLNSSPDSNNNAKSKQLPRKSTKNIQNLSPKQSIRCTKSAVPKRVINKNTSFKILEEKKKSLKRDASKFDVYEFTYDPNEEPPPQKKKKKRPTKKREPKPKTFVFKNNYDKNMAKALSTLKNSVATKTAKSVLKSDNAKVLDTHVCTTHPVVDTVVTAINTQTIPTIPSLVAGNSDKSHHSMNKYNSIRVEDIALDFEPDHSDDINYSPVQSPCLPSTSARDDIVEPERPITTCDPSNPTAQQRYSSVQKQPVPNNDPLNLRDDLSFFDDQPVASSSMNVSVRHPEASPWRAEFGSLPIKWQVNTYVKPNMTPAIESSFINFNENKKKHVYTNIVPVTTEENDLPQIYEDNASKLKQQSIISFIREVVEKNAKKKKDKKTPVKANNLFQDLYSAPVYKGATLDQKNYITPKKNVQNNVITDDDHVTPSSQNNSEISHENEIDHSKEKETNNENVKDSSKKKKKNQDVTYFGFDDTEQDQENVSPTKKLDKRRLRALKPRSRAVLQEINSQKGPIRAKSPVAIKSKPIESSETANRLFDQMKSANEPPVFPDKEPTQSNNPTNITEIQNNEDSSDDQSVHLFEDVELVHHLKAHRKSYGKVKKTVAFRQNSISDSDVALSDVAEKSASSDEDDLHDLTFKIPEVEPKKTARKKKSKKPKLSKKEEQEVEAWAAGFNSMCEDIEEFDLVVE